MNTGLRNITHLLCMLQSLLAACTQRELFSEVRFCILIVPELQCLDWANFGLLLTTPPISFTGLIYSDTPNGEPCSWVLFPWEGNLDVATDARNTGVCFQPTLHWSCSGPAFIHHVTMPHRSSINIMYRLCFRCSITAQPTAHRLCSIFNCVSPAE